MFKYFLRSIFLIGIFLLSETSAHGLSDTDPCSINDLIDLARSYRLNPYNLPEEEKLRKQEILCQLPSVLPIYHEQEQLSATLSHFLTQVFGEKAGHFKIEDAATTELRGKSNDFVFFIKDLDGHLQYVIKAFRDPLTVTSKFLPEISALDFLIRQDMRGTESVRPLAAALCLDENRQFGLLLETAAKGKRMDQYLKEIGKYPKESLERKKLLSIALQAFKRLGESLALLHSFKDDRPQRMPQEFLDKMSQKYQEVISNPLIVKKLMDSLDFFAFQKLIAQIIQEAKEVEIHYSFRHGDAHLGNMLYDAECDSFAFIDVAKLHYSMAADGKPLSDGAQEFVRTEESLRKNAIGLLTDEETEALALKFKQAYEQTARTILDERTIAFSKAYRKLGRLVTYASYEENPDPIQLAKEKELFTQALDYFIQQVKIRDPIRH